MGPKNINILPPPPDWLASTTPVGHVISRCICW